MLFPNRPPAPELRPGMGYAAGARGMGEVAHLGYAAGARGLGAFSAPMENQAVDAGIQPSDIDLLNNLGATDQDLQNLISGNITLTQLYANYGVTIPPSSTATANATPNVPSAPASTAQIPPGSTILYTATFNPTSAFVTASTVISQIAALLPSHGMSMLSSAVQTSGLVSQAQFTMTVQDSVGNALITDAQSVLDALLNQFTDNGKIASSVTVVTPGTTASGVPGSTATGAAAPATDIATWLESNALYIGLAVFGLVLLNNMTGGKRR